MITVHSMSYSQLTELNRIFTKDIQDTREHQDWLASAWATHASCSSPPKGCRGLMQAELRKQKETT